MKEIWNKVRGFKYYEVSNLGRIRSLDRSVKHNYGGTAIKKGKVISPSFNCQGYLKVHLKEGKKDVTRTIHRLVYEAFYGKVPFWMQVNHINEDKTDNRLENLNVLTPKDNTNWGSCIERRRKKCSVTMREKQMVYENNYNAKPILQFDLDGNLIKEWDCIKTAAEYNNMCYQTIWKNATGRSKSSKGYIWKYKEVS